MRLMMSHLDVAKIRQPLSELANAGLENLESFSSVASTNTYLLAQAAPPGGRYRVAVADHQTSGRGRHYRHWISAPGSSLCMSVAFTFGRTVEQLSGLTLAIGTGVIGALQQLGFDDVALKWPNDIVALDSKLGGVLTEIRSGKGDGTTVVTGVGLNVRLPEKLDIGGGSNWSVAAVDLYRCKKEMPERELLAGTLIDHLFRTFTKFDELGLAGFIDDWQQYDWLRDREITVDMPDKQVTGIAAGIDHDGALLVDGKSGRSRVISGSIVMVGARLSP
jgi:BirA family biotin operon repressor/biotin-[acetyl-CoA-carboxylase] ligase